MPPRILQSGKLPPYYVHKQILPYLQWRRTKKEICFSFYSVFFIKTVKLSSFYYFLLINRNTVLSSLQIVNIGQKKKVFNRKKLIASWVLVTQFGEIMTLLYPTKKTRIKTGLCYLYAQPTQKRKNLFKNYSGSYPQQISINNSR